MWLPRWASAPSLCRRSSASARCQRRLRAARRAQSRCAAGGGCTMRSPTQCNAARGSARRNHKPIPLHCVTRRAALRPQVRICQRFWAALILTDLVAEAGLPDICARYGVNRGDVQGLQVGWRRVCVGGWVWRRWWWWGGGAGQLPPSLACQAAAPPLNRPGTLTPLQTTPTGPRRALRLHGCRLLRAAGLARLGGADRQVPGESPAVAVIIFFFFFGGGGGAGTSPAGSCTDGSTSAPPPQLPPHPVPPAPPPQSRVLHGVRPEILALSEIPYVRAYTARLLYKAGFRTPEAVAAVTVGRGWAGRRGRRSRCG